VKFFEWRGVDLPDVCADEALDRLARRLEEDVTIREPRGYAHGIARHLLLEQRRRPLFTSIDVIMPHARHPATEPDDEEDERMRACLDRCLEQMAPDQRSVVLGYYEGERELKIARRRRIAEALGLSENALRSRVQRFRNRLQECVEACLEGRGVA
jgi:RNA polymerase sigma factor (sigma-70 family)